MVELIEENVVIYSYSFSENKHGGILSGKKAQHKRKLAESFYKGS